MHILHILDHSIPVQDGYSYRTLALLRGQHALGWQTSHLTSAKHGEAPALKESVDGFEFYRTPQESGVLARTPIVGQFSYITGMRKRLDEIIPQLEPDILHAHSPALDGVAAVKAGRKHGIPVVYEVRGFWEDAAVDQGTSTEGGLRYRATRAMETWVLRNADRVTTICEGLRSDIAARGIPTAKMTVIPNGADPDKMSVRGKPDAALVKELGLEGCTVLGFIGSFYAYEGLHILVEAMSHLAKARDDVKVLLVGGGLEVDRVNALVSQFGIEDKVVRVGRVPQAEVERYYDMIDVLVYPRLSMRITELVTPMKPLEAMTRKQIVLASDVGGHRELVTHGKNGYLFPPDNPKALADSVIDVLDRKNEWEAIQNTGRDYVLNERNWTQSVSRYPDVYGPLVGAVIVTSEMPETSKEFIEEQLALLETLRKQEQTLAELTARRAGLEVDVIVADTTPASSEAKERVPIGEARAGRLVELVARRSKVQALLRRSEKDGGISADTIKSRRESAKALEQWLSPREKPKPSMVKTVAPVILLAATAAALWAAWAVHPILLIVLMPIAGAFSFLTGTGYDADFKRAGAQRRFQTSGLTQPRKWEEAPVSKFLEDLQAQTDRLEIALVEAAAMPEIDDEERAALEAELESIELDSFSLCAGTELDPEELDGATLKDLTEVSEGYRIKKELEQVGRKVEVLKRDVDHGREAIYKLLAKEGLAPAAGKADLDSLAAGLESLARRTE